MPKKNFLISEILNQISEITENIMTQNSPLTQFHTLWELEFEDPLLENWASRALNPLGLYYRGLQQKIFLERTFYDTARLPSKTL